MNGDWKRLSNGEKKASHGTPLRMKKMSKIQRTPRTQGQKWEGGCLHGEEIEKKWVRIHEQEIIKNNTHMKSFKQVVYHKYATIRGNPQREPEGEVKRCFGGVQH